MNALLQPATPGRINEEVFLTIESSKLEWFYGGSEGFWIKDLFHDENTGQKTLLLKIDPGAFADNHAHEQREQIYVIEGDFFDQNRSYGPGDFVVREPKTNHVAGSKSGANIVLIFV